MNSVGIWVPHPRHALATSEGTIPRLAAKGSFTVRPLNCPNAHTLPDRDSVIPSPFIGMLWGDLIEIL
jgi:hypothetical protein